MQRDVAAGLELKVRDAWTRCAVVNLELPQLQAPQRPCLMQVASE